MMNSKNKRLLIKRMALGAIFALSLFLAMPGRADAAPRPRPDFDGDGFADLVIGAPDEDVLGLENTGVIHVIYGTPGGPNAVFHNQYFNMGDCTWPFDGNVPGIQPGVRFGSVLAWGDFNGDGYDDLAIGMPDYEAPYAPDGMPQAGMVYILKGTEDGLDLSHTQYLVSTNIGGPFLNVNQNEGDRFGATLAAGNFNGDSIDGRPIDDLVIGTPGEDVANGAARIQNAGEVYVLRGRSVALGNWKPLEQDTARGWNRNSPGIEGEPQIDDVFGSALVTGDFNGDGRADLAIGVPGDSDGRGAVNVIYGSPGGLSAAGDQLWHQDIAGVPGVRQLSECFGSSLAAGNFNGDSNGGRPIDDLAIGAPKAGQDTAGKVSVIQGSADGLTSLGSQLWTPNTVGIADDGAFVDDQFGFALVAGNFNGDAWADLAIGAPFADPGGVDGAGAVNVIYGSAGGLNAFVPRTSQYGHQNNIDFIGVKQPGDFFGYHLAVGDFDGNGISDLVIGVPNDHIGIFRAGAVNLIYGSPTGLRSIPGPGLRPGTQIWHQNSPGVPDFCEADDGFGVGARR